LPSTTKEPAVAVRLARSCVPPTAPPKVTVPVPLVSVRLWLPAVAASTVLAKSIALLVVASVSLTPSVTALL
jgi:hypothetical protein